MNETAPELCEVLQRGDGAVIVRVPSDAARHDALPDAVFAFRCGDPQYDFWREQLARRQQDQPADT